MYSSGYSRSEPAPTPEHRLVIDTDPGIDDAMALLIALTAPDVEVAAITVAPGNCTVDICLANALAISELAGAPDVPIYRGAAESLARGEPTAGSSVHGPRGLGAASLTATPRNSCAGGAVDGLLKAINESPGRTTIVSLAPLTNIAMAIRAQPSLPGQVKRLVIMGGTLREPGNSTQFAECNVYNDPEAAAIVLESGMPVTMIPLDVTRRAIVRQSAAELFWDAAGADSDVARFFAEATRDYFKIRPTTGAERTALMHDPATLLSCLEPDLVRLRQARVRVELDEAHLGRIVEVAGSDAGATIEIGYWMDSQRFESRFGERMGLAAEVAESRSRSDASISGC